MKVAALAVVPRHVADDVSGHHDLVGAFHQVLRIEVDLALAAGGDLVEMCRRLDAAFGHPLGHLGPQVHQTVGGWTREIAETRARLVTKVGALAAAFVPGTFDGIDMIEGLVLPLLEAHVVKDEKLEFGCQQALLGEPGAAHVAHGLARDVPGVSGIILVRDRIVDVADHRQRGLGHERVNERCLGLGKNQQIGFVDGAPAHHARTVECNSFLECILGQGVGWYREMLPDPWKIHEPQIDRGDLSLPDLGQYFFGSHAGLLLGRWNLQNAQYLSRIFGISLR